MQNCRWTRMTRIGEVLNAKAQSSHERTQRIQRRMTNDEFKIQNAELKTTDGRRWMATKKRKEHKVSRNVEGTYSHR